MDVQDFSQEQTKREPRGTKTRVKGGNLKRCHKILSPIHPYRSPLTMNENPAGRREARSSSEGSISEDFDNEIDENENDNEDESKDSDDIENNAEFDFNCTEDFCEIQLDDKFWHRYRVNVPDGTDLEKCEQCTISMEVIYDGESWVSIAFSEDGGMVGSEAVM